jgi:hypothetical protein
MALQKLTIIYHNNSTEEITTPLWDLVEGCLKILVNEFTREWRYIPLSEIREWTSKQ